MPAKNDDLHGSAPDESPVALLLIDVINDLEFPDGEALLRQALPMAERLAALKRRARRAGIPTIYANDNFGRWRSDFRAVVERCRRPGVRGRPLVELLAPDEQDYFVLKPKHSAFYSTTLDTLLDYLKTQTLVLTGIAANSCVLLTASEAFLRDFALIVPSDCTVSVDPEDTRRALAHMDKMLEADVRPSGEIDLEALARALSSSG